MADSTINVSEQLFKLIEVQARMNEKLDHFTSSQNEIKAEVNSIKADVSDLKTAHHTFRSSVKTMLTIFGTVWTGFVVLVLPYISKKLGF